MQCASMQMANLLFANCQLDIKQNTIKTMPTSLIYTEGKTVFIQMDRIIDQGMVMIYDRTNQLVLYKEFKNSNFEKLSVDTDPGNYTIKLILERNIITKKISLN